ncbi:MAG: methyltransferase domain-containing protein [Mycobacteriaceae bacterium]|nr:methyltransferase domain-containing protein [Mycobacteriaceae bacterium]
MPWSSRVHQTRIRSQAEMLGDYVQAGDSVLDVGCGAGYLANNLHQLYAAVTTGLDVQDFRRSDIPFRCFDGTSIPFPDKSFDHVVLSFVLHHSQDPLTLIRECHRVARRSVIVFEDMPDNRFGKILTSIHVGIFNEFYRLRSTRGDYRSALDWLEGNVARVVRTLLPVEWFDVLYRVPRFLLVYQLSDA